MEEEASSSTQLFVQAPGATWLWFNIALSEEAGLRAAYAFAGWLVGQMCANRASLCVPLPDLIFDKLLAGTSFQVQLSCPRVECLLSPVWPCNLKHPALQPPDWGNLVVCACARSALDSEDHCGRHAAGQAQHGAC